MRAMRYWGDWGDLYEPEGWRSCVSVDMVWSRQLADAYRHSLLLKLLPIFGASP